MECIIEAYNLGKSSPIEGAPPILDDCSIFIGPGMTTIVGPSGAGKTSLLYALSGLDAPSTGKVFTLGGMSTRSRTNAEIAERLVVEPASVRRYVSRVLAKTGPRDRVRIAIAWTRAGV